jgi:hypothetical protein
MKIYRESGGIAPLILNLDARLRRVINMKPRPFYRRRRGRRYPLDGRMDRLQNQSGYFGEKINLLPLPEVELQFVGGPASILITLPTELSWLQL